MGDGATNVVVHEPAELGRGGSTAEKGVVPYRMRRIRSHMEIAGRWLDCGCADGSYAAALLEAGASQVDGVDIEPDRADEAARRWAHEPRLSFRAAPAESLPFDDGTFDAVLLNEVLEHVGDQRAALREIRRVLVRGGRLVVFSPNRWFPFEGHGAVLGPVRVGKPVPLIPWLPQRLTARTMTARSYWPHQLALVVGSAGLEVEALDFALPLFTKYRWMPPRAIDWYTRALPRLDRIRLVRRFGVSTFVLARKPA